MELHYWKSPKGNFGDDLNEWLWDSLLPGFRTWDPQTTLVGVGTILNSNNFPTSRSGHFLVVGSGVGNGNPPDISDQKKWDIKSLRGPRSAMALGLPRDLGLIDPAIMIPKLPAFQAENRSGRPIFIPHISSVDHFDWDKICNVAGIDYVSPRGESASVIRRIAKAPLVLAESMHAAIVADAFRTPWIALRISRTFNGQKWLDWSDSLEIELKIHPLFPIIENITNLVKKRKKSAQAKTLHQVPYKNFIQPENKPILRKIRLWIEARLASGALRSALSHSPNLSNEAILSYQQDRFQVVLDAIIKEYGS